METQLFHDRFGVMLYDDDRKILEIRWFSETESMTDDEYMDGWSALPFPRSSTTFSS